MTSENTGAVTVVRTGSDRDLTNGRLHILVSDSLKEDTDQIMGGIVERLSQAAQEGIRKTIPAAGVCRQELDRLLQIAESIVSDPPVDLFQYLPLTKAGLFNGNHKPLIADSKITEAYISGESIGEYPEKYTVQLRLVPDIQVLEDYLKTKPDIRRLDIGWFNDVKKAQPIFDASGNPSKVETKRAAYLPDDQIRPGCVYEDKNGTPYLYLTGLPFTLTESHLCGDGSVRESNYEYGPGDKLHMYVRWTKKLENRLAGNKDLCNFLRIMSKHDAKDGDSWTRRVSARQSPRKFVREVVQAVNPEPAGDDSFEIPVPSERTDLSWAKETVFRYAVKSTPDNNE